MAKHTVMVKATPLPNLAGRSKYISDPRKQENLLAVLERGCGDYTFHQIMELQQEHIQNQSKYLTDEQVEKRYKIVDGREFMLVLDNRFINCDYIKLLNDLADMLTKQTGQPVIQLGLHLNSKKTSLHVHGIMPEYRFAPQTHLGAVEKRNRYYDENGKQSTKKACVDENGNLKEGCKLIKKGKRRTKTTYFETEKMDLRNKEVLKNIKKQLTNYMNQELVVDKYRWDKDPLKLPSQNIPKYLSAEAKEKAEERNVLVKEYNQAVDDHIEFISNHCSKEVVEQEIEFLKERRDNIKGFADGTNTAAHWLDSIRHHIDAIKKRTLEFINEIKKMLEQRKEEPKMLSEERKEEILKTDEFYNTIPEDEYYEEGYKEKHDKWYDSLTDEEREFLDRENEKYESFLDQEINGVKTHKNVDSSDLELSKAISSKKRSDDLER